MRRVIVFAIAIVTTMWGCGRKESGAGSARNLLLITIDTLRADHVGAYGYSRARTPLLDELAASGVRFDHAYAAAPITLPSHATILTGRYPPGHGARDNGIHVSEKVATLATELKAHGLRTAAFVAAFPLDHQFGLNRGFDVYDDRLPRDPAGRLLSERPASQVVDAALTWLKSPQGVSLQAGGGGDAPRFFVWLHLFEPHAPYGNPMDGRPAIDRYDEEIAIADREAKRLWEALGSLRSQTAVIVAGDHGEAFGEHGEYAHSVFVYDTTLRVPLIVSGPGIGEATQRTSRKVVPEAVTLADIAPTATHLLGFEMKDVDGVDLSQTWTGGSLAPRELYAESFAPLVEFGWAPLRSVRADSWKFIAAPKPELYDVGKDGREEHNLFVEQPDVVKRLDARVSRYSGSALDRGPSLDPSAADRLRSLGYSAGSNTASPSGAGRPDPKDRREMAARLAQVVSGELSGDALLSALEGIVRDEPGNGQALLRLGYAHAQRGDCGRAEGEFHRAIEAGVRTADSYVGLAGCLGQRGDLAGAEGALNEARRVEPDNPMVIANLGILKAGRGDTAGAIDALKAAVAADPGLLEAQFNLALVYAKAGRRAEAQRTAHDLLQRLPGPSPQRAEVERLLKALDGQ
ncbi:MAG TPA: sulfatase-like hydrolase/transferase [Vicinamibacterales bacterium]|jgi:Flp pilus assembly protein TadD